MVVTSANPSEGKSTVVSNLGIAVAEVNQKVLLITPICANPDCMMFLILRTIGD